MNLSPQYRGAPEGGGIGMLVFQPTISATPTPTTRFRHGRRLRRFLSVIVEEEDHNDHESLLSKGPQLKKQTAVQCLASLASAVATPTTTTTTIPTTTSTITDCIMMETDEEPHSQPQPQQLVSSSSSCVSFMEGSASSDDDDWGYFSADSTSGVPPSSSNDDDAYYYLYSSNGSNGAATTTTCGYWTTKRLSSSSSSKHRRRCRPLHSKYPRAGFASTGSGSSILISSSLFCVNSPMIPFTAAATPSTNKTLPFVMNPGTNHLCQP